MDSYFKLLRAEEEIIRLNVEIRRFLTFMHDEDAYLLSKELSVRLTDPSLAYQILVQSRNLNRFTPCHVKNLNKTQQLQGFSGNLSCGVRITEPSLPAVSSLPSISSVNIMAVDYQADVEADLEEEQDGEDEEQAVLVAYCSVLELTCDEAEVTIS
jgi:hypothetical protein